MNKPFFRKSNLPVFLIYFALVLIIIIDACRKVDINRDKKPGIDQTSRFFTIPALTDSRVKAIAEKIKKQNDQYHFVNDLVKRVGLPKWNKALIAENPNSTNRGADADSTMDYIYIPFADTAVEAFLIVGLTETDTLLRLLNKFEYKNFSFDTVQTGTEWTARQMFYMFGYFEKEVLNAKLFVIDDPRLISLTDSSKKAIVTLHNNSQSKSSRTSLFEQVNLCWTVDVCYEPPGGNYQGLCGGECDENCQYFDYDYEDCVTFWVDGGAGAWTNGQPPFIPQGGYVGGPGNGGNGGGTWWPDICEGNTYCSSPGWHNRGITDPFTYHPEIYDTIGIANYMQDSFPCTYNLLNTELPNLNYIAQLAGANIFNDPVYTHLQFDTLKVSKVFSDSAAWTEIISPAQEDDGGFIHFTAIIHLDPWYLRHATKEGLIVIILHETMHAILRFRFAQYEKWKQNHVGPIDSFFMIAHYPIYWEHFVAHGIPPGSELDHEIMGRDLVDSCSKILRPFFNPAVSSALRDSIIKALFIGSINQTSYFNSFDSAHRCRYYQTYLAAITQWTGGMTIDDCDSVNIHYSDSLKLTPNCN